MKKTILKRSVASTLSFLMAFSTAVPNSVVYAEESGIESEIAQDYAATLSQTQNGTTSFVTDGNKTKDPTTHVQGDKVEVGVIIMTQRRLKSCNRSMGKLCLHKWSRAVCSKSGMNTSSMFFQS